MPESTALPCPRAHTDTTNQTDNSPWGVLGGVQSGFNVRFQHASEALESRNIRKRWTSEIRSHGVAQALQSGEIFAEDLLVTGRDMARASRSFLARTVRYLAGEAGVRQFLDVGTGLPTFDNTH